MIVAAGGAGCMGHLGPPAVAPENVGEHPVGVTTVAVDDASRSRHLTVEIWYPAEKPSTDAPVVYDVRAMGMTVGRLRSPAHAHRDVEPFHDAGPLPVVLLSHGRGSTRYGNASLSEVLASHGYIVAAPDHPGHTMDDQLAGIGDEERAESALDRPLDLSRVLDDLVARSANASSPFHGLVDVDRVGVAGHSFGGLAALEIVGAEFDAARQQKECAEGHQDWRCAAANVFGDRPYRYRDSRIKAALLIEPAGFDLFRADGVGRVDAPALVVAGKLDGTTPFATKTKPIYDALASPHYLLEFDQGGHLTPTDVCTLVDSIGFLAKTFGGKESHDGCDRADFTSRNALDSLSAAALPFFDLYVNGDEGARTKLADALSPEHPRTDAMPRTVIAGGPTHQAGRGDKGSVAEVH